MSLLVAGALILTASTGCDRTDEADNRFLTAHWRRAVGDTILQIIDESQRVYEAGTCQAVPYLWLPQDSPLTHFSAEDRVISLATIDEITAYYRRIGQNRVSTSEEIQLQTVRILNEDAAYVVTRSVQSTEWSDGRVVSMPVVETAVLARQDGVWRLVYKHLSWRETPSPGR